jgi:hypothetical protein
MAISWSVVMSTCWFSPVTGFCDWVLKYENNEKAAMASPTNNRPIEGLQPRPVLARR